MDKDEQFVDSEEDPLLWTTGLSDGDILLISRSVPGILIAQLQPVTALVSGLVKQFTFSRWDDVAVVVYREPPGSDIPVAHILHVTGAGVVLDPVRD